jgi:hypothetical protein
MYDEARYPGEATGTCNCNNCKHPLIRLILSVLVGLDPNPKGDGAPANLDYSEDGFLEYDRNQDNV